MLPRAATGEIDAIQGPKRNKPSWHAALDPTGRQQAQPDSLTASGHVLMSVGSFIGAMLKVDQGNRVLNQADRGFEYQIRHGGNRRYRRKDSLTSLGLCNQSFPFPYPSAPAALQKQVGTSLCPPRVDEHIVHTAMPPSACLGRHQCHQASIGRSSARSEMIFQGKLRSTLHTIVVTCQTQRRPRRNRTQARRCNLHGNRPRASKPGHGRIDLCTRQKQDTSANLRQPETFLGSFAWERLRVPARGCIRLCRFACLIKQQHTWTPGQYLSKLHNTRDHMAHAVTWPGNTLDNLRHEPLQLSQWMVGIGALPHAAS